MTNLIADTLNLTYNIHELSETLDKNGQQPYQFGYTYSLSHPSCDNPIIQFYKIDDSFRLGTVTLWELPITDTNIKSITNYLYDLFDKLSDDQYFNDSDLITNILNYLNRF
jgi:hypothetical protein